MILTEKQLAVAQDLLDQEKACVQKYEFYANQAKDTELRKLFTQIKEDEENHYNSINSLINGDPDSEVDTSPADEYMPHPTYGPMDESENKKFDAFLCTDSIASEKYVSSAYDFNLFQFGDTKTRKLLNDIQTAEQNHAEMIYKYKVANGMN